MKFIPFPFDDGSDVLYGRFDADFDDAPIIEASEIGDRLAFYSGALIRAQSVLDSKFLFTRFAYFAQMNDATGINYAKMKDEMHRITLGQFEDELGDAGILRSGYRYPESISEIPLEEITQNTLRMAYFGRDVQYLVDAQFSFVAQAMLMRLEHEESIDIPVIVGGNMGPAKRSEAQLEVVRTG
ncbi:hypothetical protein CL619_03875 [archaeon]|nr:hypothetical protein [archaeon]|tara:strand:- start:1131 stop:1682 length:552 start_codon:yes stop_codon:yes gene_type:complete